MKTAEYQRETKRGILCELCPHRCVMSDGGVGLCKVRGVLNGELKAFGYGKISSAHIDPIEKKPLNEFHPGTFIYSIGGWGCNLSCAFCQNWSISQKFSRDTRVYTAEEIVYEALSSGTIGIAYTYNEPLISIEFIKDCAELARTHGLLNVLVTNGYINTVPGEEILPLIDALNIDIKSMDPDFYRNYCGGQLRPVLDFSVLAVNAGCHVEITNLVIPGLNDSDELLRELAVWMHDNLGADVPLHLSAYYPQHKMTLSGTPVETLLRALGICRERLQKVYIGNVPAKFL